MLRLLCPHLSWKYFNFNLYILLNELYLQYTDIFWLIEGCHNVNVRSQCVNFFFYFRNPLKELINHLNDHREEMEADAKAVTDAVAVFFSNGILLLFVLNLSIFHLSYFSAILSLSTDSTVKRISLKTEHSHSGILSSMIEHNLCCSATPMWMRTALLRDCFKKVGVFDTITPLYYIELT